ARTTALSSFDMSATRPRFPNCNRLSQLTSISLCRQLSLTHKFTPAHTHVQRVGATACQRRSELVISTDKHVTQPSALANSERSTVRTAKPRRRTSSAVSTLEAAMQTMPLTGSVFAAHGSASGTDIFSKLRSGSRSSQEGLTNRLSSCRAVQA